jgi:HEAT repeat protein
MVYSPALKAFAVWHAPEAVPALLPFVNDRNNFVRATAIEALGSCRDPRAIPDVAARLPKDLDPALGCLIAIGPASEPALLESIHPAMQGVQKRMTIDALALIGTKNSIPPLQAMLGNKPDVETAEIIKNAIEMIEKREK